MADLVQLSNIALRRVGIPVITALDEGTPQASTVNDLIPVVRDTMLSEHTWRFAKKQADLGGKYATSPKYGYKNAFVLPGDVLYVTHMQNDAEFSVMNINDQKVLVTDEETAVVTYRARVEEDSLWDPYFRDAFTLRLASELALAVNENRPLSEMLMVLYQQKIESAITQDSIEPPEVRCISPSVLVDVRSNSGTWGSDYDHKIKIL